MKVRIKGNSLRYRLTKSEVSLFEKAGMLTEHIDFGDEVLIYAVEKAVNLQEMKATFSHNTITLYVPANLTADWLRSDKVGFEQVSGRLQLLLEKDFQCLDNVAEDQSDNFPNPLAEKDHG
ncbi:MAG: hypothetical protein INR69_05510 [Mucilaginibacter polytrichastri]|nr:hypothetical protein [Mucilaginibacter polytrichastri]